MKEIVFQNGDRMPLLGLGTWKSSPGEVYAAVKEAIRVGYRHIDSAAIYNNEREVGQAISELIGEGVVRREDLWITSKLWNDSHHEEDVRPALEETLSNLQLDYLDLYLMHWPVAIRKGLDFPRKPEDMIPLEEIPLLTTWEAMIPLKDDGLVRHLGVSNFNVPKLKHLLDGSSEKPEMNQVEMHPYLVQKELTRFAKDHSIHLTAYSPLGSGDRPTAQRDGLPVLLQNKVVKDIAHKKNATPAQVLISFQLSRGISVIPKSVNPQRIRENYEARHVVLSDEEINELEDLDEGMRYLNGGVWVKEGSPYTLQSLWEE